MLQLKVCGMKLPRNIQEVASLQPDYLGFIFFENSPRNFTGQIPQVNPEIKKTGVFVNASPDFIRGKIREHQLQAVQLHGEEPPSLCEALKAENVEVFKVFSVKDDFDLAQLKPYEEKVDLFLFDTYGKARGGNGKTFNWELLKNYSSNTPFFLSGGIGLQEVEQIKELRDHFKNHEKEHLFYGIDVNSRFETEPGVKNLGDLKKLNQELGKIGPKQKNNNEL